MSLEPTADNVIGRWGQCVALALMCAELGIVESPESIERRRRVARLALEEPINYADLLEELGVQRAYMRELLEHAGRDSVEAMRRVVP